LTRMGSIGPPLERRLRRGCESSDVRFGWSNFPEDGAALDVLSHLARAGLPRPSGRPAVRPAGAVPSPETRECMMRSGRSLVTGSARFT